jgi:hypothetical protein
MVGHTHPSLAAMTAGAICCSGAARKTEFPAVVMDAAIAFATAVVAVLHAYVDAVATQISHADSTVTAGPSRSRTVEFQTVTFDPTVVYVSIAVARGAVVGIGAGLARPSVLR